jgi:tol-pal system protein YbgF
MRSSARIAFLIAALGAGQAQAGLFDDDEARKALAEHKTKTEARFDQQAGAQLELANQIQRQAEEIARLRGQLETLTYELENAKKRQQDFYLDLDSRLRKLEPQAAPAATPAAESDGSAPAHATSADPTKEAQDYEVALNQFKAARYKEAGASFAAFVQKYPDSNMAPNAQYWLGNAWYAQRNCAKAIEVQSSLASKWPTSSKAPDALLAVATCQTEMGNPNAATRTLNSVIAKYPDAPAAGTAKERLKKK